MLHGKTLHLEANTPDDSIVNTLKALASAPRWRILQFLADGGRSLLLVLPDMREVMQIQLAYDLETAAAETYQSAVGVVSDVTLNVALMSVGGVEARHAAVLASVRARPSGLGAR